MTRPFLFILIMISYISFGRQTVTPPEAPAVLKGNLRVIVKNFKSDKGQTNIVLYNDPKTFPDKPGSAPHNIWAKINKGMADVTFEDIPYGDYALTAYHDENDNHKLDLSFIGIPQEGIAVSNDARGFILPRFKDAKVILNIPNKTTVMSIVY
jgi:uncharacterized protein (DUF2141 family)